ncbi:gamma-glutamyltransferase family protein [Caldimonas sp. KR1-144]|uniref:gamma-glutamyltransferase family protein n=1 Tax=Caldimonas sp. KR1-144 TaxID=3400911 RepID=UPI003BFE8694
MDTLAFDFDARRGYSSQRLPVFARNVVATSHPLAAQAGLRMLLAGGNAVDAAIAAAAALTVLEPVSNGLGSDAFCLLHDGTRLHALNASGRAPAAWTRERFVAKYGADARTPPRRGVDSVTVPGAVSAWVALSERFGKLPFADLLQPAIAYARDGAVVPPVVAAKWAAAVPQLRDQPGFAQAFMVNGTRAPRAGELWRFPAAARALEAIALTRGEAFYRGEIARAIAAHLQAHGGAMSEADLAAHRCDWVEPVSLAAYGKRLHELPPNGQGLATLIALGISQRFDLASMPSDAPETLHLQIEAMKLAFADAYRYIADPAAMRVTPADLLAGAYLDARAALIDPKRAQAFEAGAPGDLHRRGGTVYLTAADASGLMVSFIQSNYQGFGSGVVEPAFGISLQNRGHGFSLDPASENLVAPGKRPFHTIIPAFLTDGDGAARMSFGVMGANMQPQGQLQAVLRMLAYGQHPQMACDAPRWRFNEGLDLNVEAGMPEATVKGLLARGHQLSVIDDPYQDFGAGQFIWRLGDAAREGYAAASDPRRDGQAVGF